MVHPSPPKPPANLQDIVDKVGATTNRPPATLFLLDDNIPFHATRIVLLTFLAGTPGIEGRTKLAKLDFFIRYPDYLLRAAEIEGKKTVVEEMKQIISSSPSVESHMIRYKYGPWDQKYYLVLAYLTGKKLVKVEQENNLEIFLLTETGVNLANSLLSQPEFHSLSRRCRVVKKLFGNTPGTRIKDFIYHHFPEVVQMPQRQIIPVTKQE